LILSYVLRLDRDQIILQHLGVVNNIQRDLDKNLAGYYKHGVTGVEIANLLPLSMEIRGTHEWRKEVNRATEGVSKE